MKNCLTCGHTQEEGRFCGKCGTPIDDLAVNETAGTIEQPKQHEASYVQQKQPQTTQQSSENIEIIKEKSKLYFNYFLEQLKVPSSHFNVAEGSWKNSLISIVLYVILTSLAVYILMGNFFGGGYGFFGSFGPSFIQVFFYMSIFFVLLITISLLAVFITAKLFSDNLNFTSVIGKFGGYYALPMVFSLGGILFLLLKSYTYSMILIYIGFAIVIGIIPTFVMLKLLSQKSKNIDSFYAFIIYLIVTVVLSAIVVSLIIDSTIGEYLEYFL